MDKKILLLLFLVSGFAFSQTTVTLQDQCNCEVLSGTAVTSPGTTTPSGADTGDIYVNTNTGVIYFWDGDSWELTSSDDQLLQNFSFNSGTNILSLDIEDGNTVNVDLSSLSGTGTDDQLISLAGNILTLEDGGTVNLSPYLDNTDDQTITAFSIDASNILTLTLEDGNTQTVDLSGLVGTDDQLISLAGNILSLEDGGNVDLSSYLDNTDDQIITAFSIDASNILTLTLEDGNTQTVDLSGLVGTDDQTAAEVTYDNTVSLLTATDVQAAIDEINALAGTVALVDNGDGTYDFTDAAGNTTIISDTSISTMVDNADGTYTYTDESGVTQIIDTNASSNPYDNTTSGLTATDVQAAIDEINALAGTVALVDNGDGTYDFTDAAGNTTIISDTSISTMVDNADGTYTYTDESGVTQTIDTNASSNPYDNTASGLTATDVQAAIDEINALAGTVALVDNGDGTYDFTDAAGNTTIISDTSISTMVDNADGTYTYTDESGVTQIIDTNASSNPYDNTTSGLTATDVQAAIDEINALAGTVALVDNGDGTYDFTDAAGNTTIISDTSISTMVDNADGTYTYTDESGVTQTIDTNASSNPYDNTTSGLTATDVQAAIDEINALAGTVALVDNGDGTYDFTDAAGNTTVISDTSISTLVDNGDGSFTYTDETGTTTIFTETLTTLVDNFNGTFTYTNEDGVAQIISKSDIIDNFDGTYVFNNNDGSPETIDTRAISNPYDNTTSGLTATDVQAAIDEINALAGTVALVDNGDGTYDFTDAAGNTTIISDTSISTMVDNADGTYTYTDESGVTQTIDTNASSNPYDNTTSGLTATDVQAAIDEINALAGTVALVDNGDGTYDFTDAAGNTTIISDTSISTMVDNADGTYTYTDESGATQTIDTNASSNPYDNTASGLTATDVQAALDELAAGSTDDQNISGSGLAGTDLTIGIENGTNEVVDLSSLVESVIAGTGAISVTDDGNGNYTVNSTDPDEDLTNELTLLGSGAPVVVPSNAGVTYVDTVAGQLYVWDGAVWNVVGGNASPDLDGDPTNELNTAFAVNAGNLEITDNGSTLAVPLTSLGTDDQTAAEVTYDNTASGLTAIDVQAAIDELDAAAGNVSLVDNLDGTYTFMDAAGNPTTISDTSISTMVDNLDGTYTYTDEAGVTQTIDTNASSNPYDNTASGLVATDVQAAIDELDAAAGNVSLVDNLDGTYTFTDAAGNPTTISDTSISTMVDNLDGTYTYTDEAGVTQTIDTNASSNPYDNTASSLVATDVQAAIDELDAAAGNVALVDNLDGTYTFTDAAGNPTTISDTSISTMVDNLDGTYTYTDEAGVTQTINTNASSNPYDNTVSGLTAIDVQDALDELAAGSTDDQNISGSGLAGTDLTIGIENGASEVVDLSSLVETVVAGTGAITVTDDGNGNYTVNSTDPDEDLTNELTLIGAGAPAVVPSNAGVTYVDSIAGQLYIWDGAAWNAVGGNASPDLDGDPTNEQNTVFAVNGGNLEITDSGGTLSVPLASLGTDDQNIDVLTLNAATNILTVGIENGSDLTVDLSGLVADGSETVVTGAGINVVTGTGTSADPYVITATEVDGSITNEVNTAFAINAGNLEITDSNGTLSVPLASLGTDDQNIDVLTLNAATNILTVGIENGSDLTVDLSGLVADGSETVVTGAGINVVTGTGTSADPYVITATEVDGSITNEVNTAFAINAGNLEITDSNGTLSVPLASLGTDDQNIDVLTLNAATNILTVGIENGSDLTVDLSGLVADGSETVVTGAGINVVTGTGTSADPYVITATEVDGSITNEVNTAFAINAGNLEITDSNGTLSVPLASLGTDDQNIDVLTLNAATNILTVGIENGSDLTVDLSGLVADGSETVVTGAGINVVTGTGTSADPYVITATEVDGDITNELTLIGAGGPAGAPSNSGVTYVDNVAGQLYIWDGAAWNAVGGSASPDLDGDPTNEQNTVFAVNGGNLEITDSGGTLSVPLASLGTDDQNIDVLTLNAATNILTVGIENGSDLTVDLSGLVADGSETVVTGAGINVVTGTGTSADPYVITATEVDGSITNEVNTAFAINAGNLEITDSNGTLSVPLASLGTDDQNIDVLTLNAATNILTVGIENGSDLTVDLSGLVADGSETVVTGAGINVVTGTGTSADPYVITATEVDGSITNEVNTAFAINAGNLEITDSNGTLSVPLASLGTDDQNIDVLTLNAATNILTVGIENGSDLTVDLSGLVADGSETVVTGAGINVVTGTGTSADPYVITATEVDGSITNEVNTAFAINAGNLEITDSNGTLSVPLASLGTDDQNIDVLTLNAATNILTVGIENGSDLTVDLSGLVADGSETVVTGAGINVVTGTGTSADPYVITATEVDGSITNEVNTAFAINAGNLEITDSNGTLSVPLASLGTDDQNIDVLTLNAATNILTVGIENGSDLTVDLSGLVADGSETVVTGAGINVVTGTGTSADPYVITATEVDGSITNEVNTAFAINAGNLEITDSNGTLSVPLASLGTDDQNIDVLTLNAATNILTVGIENGSDLTVDLSGLVADGSETVVTGAGINVVTGTGTSADPYVITATEVDGSITNEVNTAFAINAGNLEITDSNGTLSVPLASLGTDDQNIDVLTLNAATNILTVGIENGSDLTVDLSGLVADGSETVVTGAGINVVTGTGTSADPYVITATEVDGSITNEVNTAFAINAGNLEITDSNGTLSVPLASLGTDDQNIDVLTLNAATNILTVGIENGSDLTVDLSGLVADGSETVVTGAGINVVTGTGTSADPYVITATEVDGSITNEVNTAFAINAGNLEITDSNGTLSVPLASLGTDDQNIDVLTLNAATNILTVGIENGSDLTVDLSGLVADGSETVVTGAGINVVTGTGTSADPYVITATEVDGSITNEVNTAFAINAGNLEITDSNGTLSVPLASLGTDDQNIDVLTLNAATNILTVGIENGSDLTVDLSGLVADGSETVVTGAGINVVTGTGTSADPYVITATEVDGSITNEVNTAFAINAGNLEITDSNGTLSVPLASLGTDDQNIESLAVDTGTNILTVGIEDGTSQTVDLSHLDDAGTDDQYDDEVLLRTPIDVDEGGVGSPTNETTVEEVIQAIAPITSKAARIFYPPSIAVDASTNGSFSIDLYAQYTAQFGTPTVASAGAPAAVPTYGATELYYYVTYADPTVFNTATMAIDGNGVLSYDIIGQPSDYNSLINVVFVVK